LRLTLDGAASGGIQGKPVRILPPIVAQVTQRLKKVRPQHAGVSERGRQRDPALKYRSVPTKPAFAGWGDGRNGACVILEARYGDRRLARTPVEAGERGVVAAWHRVIGGDLDPDTKVWAELPLPWEVLTGEAECPRDHVELVCVKHGVDPLKNGWAAPRPGRKVHSFRPTPELVHGVTVSSPELVGLLRKAGWFSGKSARPVAADVVVYRDAHGFATGAAELKEAAALVREAGDRQ
jgi:hypothetical protein